MSNVKDLIKWVKFGGGTVALDLEDADALIDEIARLEAVNAELVAALESIDNQHTVDEIERLRAAIIKCGRLAGAHLSDDVSTDFLMHVPDELAAVLAGESK